MSPRKSAFLTKNPRNFVNQVRIVSSGVSLPRDTSSCLSPYGSTSFSPPQTKLRLEPFLCLAAKAEPMCVSGDFSRKCFFSLFFSRASLSEDDNDVDTATRQTRREILEPFNYHPSLFAFVLRRMRRPRCRGAREMLSADG